MDCLRDPEGWCDGCTERELIKGFCSRLSRPEALWFIINISTKLDKLYFTQDTSVEMTTFIYRIEEGTNPLLVMSDIGAELSVNLKKLACWQHCEGTAKKVWEPLDYIKIRRFYYYFLVN